jgi:ribosomal protein S18
MPSKQQLAKRKKNKKTPVDKRPASKIYRKLPTLKPIQSKYMGHANRLQNMENKNIDEDILKMVVDTEMDPVDKEYMDTLKKFIDESGKIMNMVQSKKLPLNSMTKEIIRDRIQRVYEWGEMSSIYDRQQQIKKVFDGWSIS